MRSRTLNRISCILFVFSIAALLTLSFTWGAAAAGGTDCAAGNPPGSSLLVIYVLAFDNDPASPVDLTPKYADTIQSIADATAANSEVTAVVLADLHNDGDTHLLEIYNGTTTVLPCLPDADGTLNSAIVEYDTADGETLGGYLLWARTRYPAEKTIFSYIGHGTFIAPETEQPIAQLITPPTARSQPLSWTPMPSNIDANPDFTDHTVPMTTTPSLITPYQLAVALSATEAIGLGPLDVVDLVHCFAASIEELYEIQRFAHAATGSPHYAFYDPSMLKAALVALSPAMTADALATQIVAGYHGAHPNVGHPHSLVAVNLGMLPEVKVRWDRTAAALIGDFNLDAATTATALQDVYTTDAGQYYLDTTFCPSQSDYALARPDQLHNFTALAQAIANSSFSAQVTSSAAATVSAIQAATVARFYSDGNPWFAPSQTWQFYDRSGISIYTPFEPMPIGSLDYHTWQSLWYTDTTSYVISGTVVSNPNPFQFVQPTVDFSWADVLYRFWLHEDILPGTERPTAFCMPELLFNEPDKPPSSVTLNRAEASAAEATLLWLPLVLIVLMLWQRRRRMLLR